MFAFAQTSRNEVFASPRTIGTANTTNENLVMQLNPRFLENIDLGILDEAKISGADAFNKIGKAPETTRNKPSEKDCHFMFQGNMISEEEEAARVEHLMKDTYF